MKQVVLLAADAERLTGLPALLAARPWAAQASRLVVHLGMEAPVEPDGEPQPPAYGAVIEAWSDAPLPIAGDPELAALGQLDVRTSQEVIGKAGAGAPPVGVTPGLSQLSFIRAVEGMPRAEAERHWSEHIPLACEIHLGMNRYVQDRLSSAVDGAAPWFGMAHLHFPDEAALRDGLFRTPEDIATIGADVAEFVCDYATMLAVEHVVKG